MNFISLKILIILVNFLNFDIFFVDFLDFCQRTNQNYNFLKLSREEINKMKKENSKLKEPDRGDLTDPKIKESYAVYNLSYKAV